MTTSVEFARREIGLRLAEVGGWSYWLVETPDLEGGVRVRLVAVWPAGREQLGAEWEQVSRDEDERHAAELIQRHQSATACGEGRAA